MKVKSCSALDLELRVLVEMLESISHNLEAMSPEKNSVMAIVVDDDGVCRHRPVIAVSLWLFLRNFVFSFISHLVPQQG